MQDKMSPRVHELFAAALRHHQGGRFVDAEQLYAQILQSDPRHADALHLLGVLAHQTGRHDAAAVLIGKAIVENARVPAFHNNLGNARKAQGRLDDAEASYQRALALKPDYFEAYYNLGLIRQARGRPDEAVACYGKVLEHKPDHAEAHNNLGNALQEQGKFEDALAAYGQALRYKPNFADAHSNAGNVQRALGNALAAIDSYKHALTHQARHPEALHNLGIVFLEQGRLEEAAAASRRALALKPDYAAAQCNLGNTLIAQGNAAAAVASFRRALELDQDFAEAALGLAAAAIPVLADTVAESLAAAQNFSRALDELAAWDRAHPGCLGQAVGSHQPFYLGYRPFESGALLARYGDLVGAAAAAQWPPRPLGRRTPGARLRLVIVSGQVRQHPVWDVILRGIVAHMDRQRFEIQLYHTGALKDAETEWARSRVDRFVQGPKPVKGWLDELNHDEPDILFYPELGMDPAACALAALRLAPVQVASWGHPLTTGLPNIDIYLSGELIEGPQAEHHYREKLVRLPGTGVCTESSGLRAEPWSAQSRPPDVVRFAVCQQPIKFDPADDGLLAQIAKEVGACEFWLASPLNMQWAAARLHKRLAAVFRDAGFDPDAHLRVTPWLPRGQFLGFLDEMDVYLDCPAFSGYTTAWQAVHRGMPVVTLEGDFLRQRLAAGLLRQIGITEGIVSSRKAYVETAAHFAERCRRPKARARCRASTTAAAARADGNLAAVRSVERTLIAAVQAQRCVTLL
jgi:predicted O-linked N-acetylglucosamine transferase (SPINDLY family)